MRTLTTLLEWALSLRERIGSNEERYEVTGIILIKLLPNCDQPTLSNMKAVVEGFIAIHPWHNEKLPYQSQEEADECMVSDGKVETHDRFITPSLWFNIRHKHRYLRRSQTYAYEQFLAKIAEELAKWTPHVASEVCSIIEVRAGTSFRT